MTEEDITQPDEKKVNPLIPVILIIVAILSLVLLLSVSAEKESGFLGKMLYAGALIPIFLLIYIYRNAIFSIRKSKPIEVEKEDVDERGWADKLSKPQKEGILILIIGVIIIFALVKTSDINSDEKFYADLLIIGFVIYMAWLILTAGKTTPPTNLTAKDAVDKFMEVRNTLPGYTKYIIDPNFEPLKIKDYYIAKFLTPDMRKEISFKIPSFIPPDEDISDYIAHNFEPVTELGISATYQHTPLDAAERTREEIQETENIKKIFSAPLEFEKRYDELNEKIQNLQSQPHKTNEE